MINYKFLLIIGIAAILIFWQIFGKKTIKYFNQSWQKSKFRIFILILSIFVVVVLSIIVIIPYKGRAVKNYSKVYINHPLYPSFLFNGSLEECIVEVYKPQNELDTLNEDNLEAVGIFKFNPTNFICDTFLLIQNRDTVNITVLQFNESDQIQSISLDDTTITYLYDEKNYLIKSIEEKNGKILRREFFYCSNSGNIDSTDFFDFELNRKWRFKFTRDKNGQLKQRIEYFIQDAHQQKVSSTSFIFDGMEPIYEKTNYFDSENGEVYETKEHWMVRGFNEKQLFNENGKVSEFLYDNTYD